MSHVILAIDPGKSSGIVQGHYSDKDAFAITDRWTVLGGLEGFMRWLDNEAYRIEQADTLVVERFIPKSTPVVPDVTPLRIEGAIEYVCHNAGQGIHWQLPSAKALVTPGTQGDRFKWLAKHGLHVPGTANDDVNDAVLHCLSYLKTKKHGPTLAAFWPDPH